MGTARDGKRGIMDEEGREMGKHSTRVRRDGKQARREE
jgi:hypothetical protein